jgi:hypothetical protein
MTTPSLIRSSRAELQELQDSVGTFDAIVGRRVLMYQRDAVATIRALSKCLRPGGVMVFQEHDTTMAPASLDPFPLHKRAQCWIQEMIAREGADLHIGFNLHRIFTQAGLTVESVRAECLVQTPDTPLQPWRHCSSVLATNHCTRCGQCRRGRNRNVARASRSGASSLFKCIRWRCDVWELGTKSLMLPSVVGTPLASTGAYPLPGS